MLYEHYDTSWSAFDYLLNDFTYNKLANNTIANIAILS